MVDLTFYDELDFIADLLWCDANDEDTGLPFTELEFKFDMFWLCIYLGCEPLPPTLEWYFIP